MISKINRTSSVLNSTKMFEHCRYLPNYTNTYPDKTRAYYGGDGHGYLTYKAATTTP